MSKQFLFPMFFSTISILILFACSKQSSQVESPQTNLPDYWKSTLSDIEEEISNIEKGGVQIAAVSPGGRNIYAVYYGGKENFHSQANYNSAVAARNPAFYARKDSFTKPVVFFLGPVHGQEIENIVGMVNLLHVAETGKDYSGKAWPQLKERIEKCRLIIIPCANPDGRARCPYDSFVGVPTDSMTKYGQGTRKDGSFYGWPGAKAVHPMQGDVCVLGSYFNDAGINPMHDDFFAPMAEETKAILEIARAESPDLTVSLHSHENKPVVLQASYIPIFMKDRIADLSQRVKNRYEVEGLPYGPIYNPKMEDKESPPRSSFNLIGALHHISGTMAFTFECSHGSTSQRFPQPFVNHDQILDVQLCLFDEMLKYVIEGRLYWELEE
jgi:hypothetical protein